MPKRATIARESARNAGYTHYFTGLPCKRGHVAPRQVSDCACVECSKINRREYWERHKEQERERTRKWRKENRETWLASAKKHYRKRAAAGTVTAPLKIKIVASQKGVCAKCRESLVDNCEFDHVIPVASGGLTTFENIEALCIPCHRKKSSGEKWLSKRVNKTA